MNRIVVKIGTGVLSGRDGRFDETMSESLVSQISGLIGSGKEMIVVTSGAIGAGMSLLGVKKKPTAVCELQALAAIGQTRLMDSYNKYFSKYGILAGQILLTQSDFDDRKRYLNIRYTIDNLLKNRVVPVINENDSVSTDEIKCGDNDRLSSLVADLTSADILILLTSVDGLLDAEGNVVRDVDVIDDRIKGMVKKSCSELGTGGMFTKIQAAYDATRSGIECYVANGKRSGVITELIKGEGVFTHFRAKVSKKTARKRWIEFGAKVKGTIIVDAGASDAILHKGKSLLSAGITGIKGTFEEGDIVSIFDNSGRQIARGVINFSAKGLGQILGKSINEIKTSVAGKIRYEAVHRDDLVLL